MEIHHAAVEKKSFKHYLQEGLMIFIAVLLGFIAESIREHISDRAKEKEYIISFIQNLKDDTTNLSNTITDNRKKVSILLKLMTLAQKDFSASETILETYRLSSNSIGSYSIFKSYDATMQQLKNSGGLRYIRKEHVADSIGKYDMAMQGIYGAGLIYTNAIDIGILASHEFLDYSIFYDSTYFSNGEFTAKPLPLLTTDVIKRKVFFNKVNSEINATKNYINNLVEKRPYAVSLLEFLKKEYHLENE